MTQRRTWWDSKSKDLSVCDGVSWLLQMKLAVTFCIVLVICCLIDLHNAEAVDKILKGDLDGEGIFKLDGQSENVAGGYRERRSATLAGRSSSIDEWHLEWLGRLVAVMVDHRWLHWAEWTSRTLNIVDRLNSLIKHVLSLLWRLYIQCE